MMKYIVTMLGVALISSSVMAGAVTNMAKWNVPWGDSWRDRAEETLDAYETQVNLDVVAIAAALATNVTKGTAAQVDTNATTSITTKTPGHVGQLLVGGVVAQYDALWHAKGSTTNDWIRIVLPTGTIGATNITISSTLGTNVLYFNAIGILTNSTP